MTTVIIASVPDGETPIFLDMGHYGFESVICQTDTKQIRECMTMLEDSKEFFNKYSVILGLLQNFNRIDEIYEENGKRWDDFMCDCVIYACYMKKYKDKPFKEVNGELIRGPLIE